jgi:hypothetical protein
VLYNILIEFCILMKLIRINRMCFNKTCSEVHIGKNLYGLKQGDAL